MSDPVDEPREDTGRFRLRSENFAHATFSARVVLPESSEALIDETDFDRDERLPYWAELWPSARALARWLLEQDDIPTRALELGCGVGLPSLALAHRGVSIVASDYYEDALLFARLNARLSGATTLETLLLDWRSPPPDLVPFPLVVAADVLYEARNGGALESLLPRLVEPGGRVVIADPGRVYCPPFLQRLREIGWLERSRRSFVEASPAGGTIEIQVRVVELFRDGAVAAG